MIFIFMIFSCSSFRLKDKINYKSKTDQIKIGFGSCLIQSRPMTIFKSIKEDEFDLFLMIGDNVYGDTESEDLLELKAAYKKQKENFIVRAPKYLTLKVLRNATFANWKQKTYRQKKNFEVPQDIKPATSI